MNILEEIALKTKARVEEAKQAVSMEQMMENAKKCPVSDDFPFEKALKKDDIAFICEVKKASPSKGLIAPDFPYLEIAKEYDAAGASAISVLTEPYYFMGANEYLRRIKEAVSIPVLRKDFTVDAYMVYEAKTLGADCILLIAAILTDEQMKEYKQIADSLGMSAIFEAHDADEVTRALNCGARIVGVNNRDLRTFTVDIGNSVRYREMVPKEIIFISESGIKTADDIARLRENGTDAVLIGETFMRSPNKKAMLDELRGKAQ